MWVCVNGSPLYFVPEVAKHLFGDFEGGEEAFDDAFEHLDYIKAKHPDLFV